MRAGKNPNSKWKIVTNGIVRNNPTFRLVLGTCPTLALTTAAMNGIYMGLATTFVLVCSNVMISLLRNIIPDKVRIPAYVLIIATFVTVLDMAMEYALPDVYDILGLYLPLIVVNCIILARAESFASCNSVGDSALDGLGMGIGFMCSLTVMGGIREVIGAGTFFGIAIGSLPEYSMSVIAMAPGGFLVYGLMMAAVNFISNRKRDKALREEIRIEELKPIIIKEGK